MVMAALIAAYLLRCFCHATVYVPAAAVRRLKRLICGIIVGSIYVPYLLIQIDDMVKEKIWANGNYWRQVIDSLVLLVITGDTGCPWYAL